MQLQNLLVLLGASIALAAPTADNNNLAARQVQTLAMPSSALPSPDSISPAVQLKQIALGLGHQNYTCDSSGTATAVGATAALFDAKAVLTKYPYLAPYLPGTVLALSGVTRDSVSAGANSASLNDKDFRMGLPSLGVQAQGYHYFNTDKLPVFTIPVLKASLTARKMNNVGAPAGYMPGPDGQAAVDWLFLADSGENKSYGGLSNVYRINTAGGIGAGACAGVAAGGVVRVPYAAEYWFYGP
jgi:hypothetical protein